MRRIHSTVFTYAEFPPEAELFKEGTSPLGGEVDIDAFTAYLTKHSPVAPGPANRVTRTG